MVLNTTPDVIQIQNIKEAWLALCPDVRGMAVMARGGVAFSRSLLLSSSSSLIATDEME